MSKIKIALLLFALSSVFGSQAFASNQPKTVKKSIIYTGKKIKITKTKIRQIQTALQILEYKLKVTGHWDKATIKAVKAFQAKNRFKPTGLPDQLTLERLGIYE